MSKRKRSASTGSALVANDFVKEIQVCRPLRLFIQKRKKKGDESNAFALRSKFLQLSTEKQMKYFQKAVEKYLQLLEEKDISEEQQVQGQLFDQLLSKKEQKSYFEYLNVPKKPLGTAAGYYSQIHKDHPDENAKPWKSLSTEEKQVYTKMLNDAREEYNPQLNNFIANLPPRLQIDFRSFLNGTQQEHSSQDNAKTEAHPSPSKLTKQQLDELHKCRPSEIYYETKVEEKPVFSNTNARNTHVRAIFRELSEKKRRKFIRKGMEQWHEFLEKNPLICEEQIPTLHLVLTKNEDILQYFHSLGLPVRPPGSALLLYNQEREQLGSQQYWGDLPQSTKDEHIKRLHKMKGDYYAKLVDFVEKTLPSNYLRFEFFRHVKYASRDYQLATKDRPSETIDDGQLKITQYLTKKSLEQSKRDQFDRITRQLFATKLNEEQRNLLQKLSNLMHQWIDEKTPPSSSPTHPKDNEVILINGDLSDQPDEKTKNKKKKKKKKGENDDQEKISVVPSSNEPASSASSTKKKKLRQ